jgi:dCTP deaminase
MLTKDQIAKEIEFGRLEIEPFNPMNLQPNSYDVRLAPKLLMVLDPTLDFKKSYTTCELVIPPKGLKLLPEKLYLGVTVERTFTPFHVPTYEGRSTTGRYFLSSHQTAGFGDVGYNGHWTLEITVKRPTVVYPYMRIGQIGFSEVVGRVERYDGHYGGSCEPLPGKAGNI